MTVKVGEIFIPSGEEKEETINLARKITVVLDQNGVTPFQTGVNAIILVLASAISAREVPTEHKVKLAKGVSDAILANLILSRDEGGTIN
jgi:hypothetical protein